MTYNKSPCFRVSPMWYIARSLVTDFCGYASVEVAVTYGKYRFAVEVVKQEFQEVSGTELQA